MKKHTNKRKQGGNRRTADGTRDTVKGDPQSGKTGNNTPSPASNPAIPSRGGR